MRQRNNMQVWTSAELAIYNAIQEVEKIGADVKLTLAITKLSEAKDLIADYIDEHPLPNSEQELQWSVATKLNQGNAADQQIEVVDAGFVYALECLENGLKLVKDKRHAYAGLGGVEHSIKMALNILKKLPITSIKVPVIENHKISGFNGISTSSGVGGKKTGWQLMADKNKKYCNCTDGEQCDGSCFDKIVSEEAKVPVIDWEGLEEAFYEECTYVDYDGITKSRHHKIISTWLKTNLTKYYK